MIHYRSWTILSLFVATFVGCGQPKGQSDEQPVIVAIEKLGGKVEFEGKDQHQHVIKVYLHSTAVQDTDLAVLEQLPKLRNLFLGKTKITDSGLEHLQKLHELQTLSLNNTNVTDVGMKSLAGLTKLKTLNVQETRVTAEGAAELRQAIPSATIAR